MHRLTLSLALACAFLFQAPSFGAIIGAQTDTFETGVQNWTNGGLAAAPITTTGGPGGLSDHYLQITGDGASAGGRIIAFNRSQWAGDFSNILTISMDLVDPNTFPLSVRIAMKSSTMQSGPGIVSNAFSLAADGQWHHAVFTINAGNFTGLVGGTFATVIPTVAEFRVLNSSGVSLNGDFVTGILGVDNISSTAIPEPATFALLGAGLAALAVARRRRRI